jgi:hypothetical protein
MSEVKGYYFQNYDIMTDEMVRSKPPATLDRIGRLGPEHEALLDTEESIDSSRREDGFRKRQSIEDTVALIESADRQG